MWLNFQVINFKAEISVIEKECARAKEAKDARRANGVEEAMAAEETWEAKEAEVAKEAKEARVAKLAKDRLKVRVKCEECKCTDDEFPNAEFCFGRGLLVCGGCECNPGVTQLNI